MTWFEDGLQAHAKKYERERLENDTRRWLRDADSAILADRNSEDSLTDAFKVSPPRMVMI